MKEKSWSSTFINEVEIIENITEIKRLKEFIYEGLRSYSVDLA